MTKKDFELIANVISNLIPDDNGDVVFVSGVVEDFCNALAKANPKFDRERFINACQPKDPCCTYCGDAVSVCGGASFLNHYDCDQCGNSWSNEYCCACNDECPVCRIEIEPTESVDMDKD